MQIDDSQSRIDQETKLAENDFPGGGFEIGLNNTVMANNSIIKTDIYDKTQILK